MGSNNNYVIMVTVGWHRAAYNYILLDENCSSMSGIKHLMLHEKYRS